MFVRLRKGREGLTRRLRFVVLAVLAGAALAIVAAASAANVRPMLASSPFAPLSGPSVPCLNGGLPCYLPSEIQQAYNFPSGPAAPNGAGQTIVVVAAYGAPFVGPDIQTFGALTGIPYPPNLTVVRQKTPVPAAQGSGQTYFWEVETDLDVQWAYAMAPRARIVLAVANSDDTLDIAQVMREVLPKYPGAIVTQSFGMDETGPASDPSLVATFSPMYLDVLRGGGTVLAASGDLGASNGTELEAMFFPELGVKPSAMAAYPASDPLVLAVGGTEGNPYPDGLLSDAGTYGGEQAWNEISPFGAPGAGGGAPSAVFDAPPWQRALHTKDRLVPDVSYNAALVGGALVIVSCRPNPADGGVTLDPTCADPSRQGYIAVGGTSAGAPQWAAIIALANQVRMSQARGPLGLVSPTLYDIARDKRAYARDFNDVTTGTNALDLRAFGSPVPSAFGFAAAPGYDLATGLGTPNVANLLGDLAKGGSGEIPGNVAHGPKADKPDKVKHHRFDPSK
jgi:subtilase family serine protease